MGTQKNINTANHNAAHSLAIPNLGGRPRAAKGKARTKRRFYQQVQNYAINLKNSATGVEKPSFNLGRLLILMIISLSIGSEMW